MSLYSDAVEAGLVLDHYESDLYLKDCPAAREVLAKHPEFGWSVFRSLPDLSPWIDVPFAYDPFWVNRRFSPGQRLPDRRVRRGANRTT